MPRISYSFMGRELEHFDNGFTTYMGFIYMEAGKNYLLTFVRFLAYLN